MATTADLARFFFGRGKENFTLGTPGVYLAKQLGFEDNPIAEMLLDPVMLGTLGMAAAPRAMRTGARAANKFAGRMLGTEFVPKNKLNLSAGQLFGPKQFGPDDLVPRSAAGAPTAGPRRVNAPPGTIGPQGVQGTPLSRMYPGDEATLVPYGTDVNPVNEAIYNTGLRNRLAENLMYPKAARPLADPSIMPARRFSAVRGGRDYTPTGLTTATLLDLTDDEPLRQFGGKRARELFGELEAEAQDYARRELLSGQQPLSRGTAAAPTGVSSVAPTAEDPLNRAMGLGHSVRDPNTRQIQQLGSVSPVAEVISPARELSKRAGGKAVTSQQVANWARVLRNPAASDDAVRKILKQLPKTSSDPAALTLVDLDRAARQLEASPLPPSERVSLASVLKNPESQMGKLKDEAKAMFTMPSAEHNMRRVLRGEVSPTPKEWMRMTDEQKEIFFKGVQGKTKGYDPVLRKVPRSDRKRVKKILQGLPDPEQTIAEEAAEQGITARNYFSDDTLDAVRAVDMEQGAAREGQALRRGDKSVNAPKGKGAKAPPPERPLTEKKMLDNVQDPMDQLNVTTAIDAIRDEFGKEKLSDGIRALQAFAEMTPQMRAQMAMNPSLKANFPQLVEFVQSDAFDAVAQSINRASQAPARAQATRLPSRLEGAKQRALPSARKSFDFARSLPSDEQQDLVRMAKKYGRRVHQAVKEALTEPVHRELRDIPGLKAKIRKQPGKLKDDLVDRLMQNRTAVAEAMEKVARGEQGMRKLQHDALIAARNRSLKAAKLAELLKKHGYSGVMDERGATLLDPNDLVAPNIGLREDYALPDNLQAALAFLPIGRVSTKETR